MPAAVKIVGISSGMNFNGDTSSPLKFCQLWFDGENVPKTTVAEYVIVPETHDRKLVLSSITLYFISDHGRWPIIIIVIIIAP